MLGIAAVLRFWALGQPGTLVFDEIYYVRDAISQLAHGYPTTWPNDDPALPNPLGFTDTASYAVHPPLGKWILGLGILLFGPDNGWGWRSALALAGVATVGITMRLAWLISRRMVIACLAGLFLAIDGVHIVLTRVALLDGFLTLFIALGALLLWRDHLSVTARVEAIVKRPPRWFRPWLLAAGLTFGAAAAIKWSGLYPLAFFMVFTAVRDLMLLRRFGRSWVISVLRAGLTAATALPAALFAYLASWSGWIFTTGGWGRKPGEFWLTSLIQYHLDMFKWHSTLTAPHPYQADALTWPLALRPTAMYELNWDKGCAGGCTAGISALPNILVTWGGVAALLVLLWLVLRSFASHPSQRLVTSLATASSFVLLGYLSGWLPWVLTLSRSAVFQFYAVTLTPFSAIALALVLGMLCGIPIGNAPARVPGLRLSLDREAVRGRRMAVAMFVAAALVLAILFFPVWSGMPVADWFWQAHMWLPGWD
ncbi:phospholipid carrier-dependent glycosyltransferase [Leucobacter viscericola]|uniref:Polyprenol-phosphate-mannose--protein mannosyltransferase n=1 Tax=Leucobacter viscericola TaxID=2714935 RepID=A0A6G7XJX6_9MICO|nr:phospholipid carrier-dependent glycosyltransferase [Leucobacter viscericola]